MKPVTLELKDGEDDILGIIKVGYKGRFDGIQVNAYMLGSAELVEFTQVNDRRISLLTRLYVPSSEISNGILTFRVAKYKGRVRFRVAIIQEHKEIESDTIFH